MKLTGFQIFAICFVIAALSAIASAGVTAAFLQYQNKLEIAQMKMHAGNELERTKYLLSDCELNGVKKVGIPELRLAVRYLEE